MRLNIEVTDNGQLKWLFIDNEGMSHANVTALRDSVHQIRTIVIPGFPESSIQYNNAGDLFLNGLPENLDVTVNNEMKGIVRYRFTTEAQEKYRTNPSSLFNRAAVIADHIHSDIEDDLLLTNLASVGEVRIKADNLELRGTINCTELDIHADNSITLNSQPAKIP